ncbi:hypothetical protein DYB35_013764 [Aphanomyces astaci]|uniref:Uncharacterized protein n=1 Tax=Aphanomyces astaci TaxID=112090 RepID=A0A418CV60_APHAT|nr:hypothetical protein DYB35_013764 [Aphanomyces astaci]
MKAYTTAIQPEVIAREVTKKLANQRSAAHIFLVSAISINLRRLYQATTGPFELFEHIKTHFESNPMDNNATVIASSLCALKLTDESCIDTLSVELIDLVKCYRVSMKPPSFNPLDPSAISSVHYHNRIWNYYTLCAMSDTFIGDKELWEIVTNSDYARNTMRPGFNRTIFDKHGSASQKKRKCDYVARVLSNVLVMTAMIAIGLVATRALIATMDGDQVSLVVLEMASGTPIGATAVTKTATANAAKATGALIVGL